MEHIDLRKLNRGELKQVRRQIVRLKKMGKTGKEIEELTGVRQNRASEIWTAYQREGDSSLEPKKRGFRKGTHLLLTSEEQAEIRETIRRRLPEEFGIPGSLWTLKKVCAYIWKRYRKKISDGSVSDYMRRWGLTCQRPIKRARKQDPSRV